MKIKTLLLLLAVCILPGSLCAGVVFSPDTLGTGKLYRDSTYRRVIKEGTANLDCYFSYPQGGWQIQRGYGGNARELERLDKFMRSSFADTLIYVRRITLTGYCSIEGSYAANEKLAHDRANGFRNYLDTEYGLARRFPVEVRYVGEDWDRLRQLVEASTLPGRAEVLAVIDNTDIFKGREKKLMDLQGGVPYNLMLAELFPLLRRVEIRGEYDLHRIIEERYRRKLTDAEFQEILARAMLTRYGMSDEFDMVALETVNNQYLGGDTSLACSAQTQCEIDRKVVELVKTQHEKAIRILTENRAKLDELAQYLYQKETITGEEFMDILNRDDAENKPENP